ncbi:MAG: ABC transporter permease subunit [Pseudobacteriovorax sp.]|nr:ABC transporter permease subunit [Pseudobacteriovorax sp.]
MINPCFQGVKLASVLAVVAVFIWIVGDIFWQGLPKINADFLFGTPSNAGRDGGIRPVILSTIYILAIAILATLPFATLTGLFFSEKLFPLSPIFRPLQRFVDILAGVPSVVFGLFGNTYFCNYLGMGYSILSGGLTLACMILPLAAKILQNAFSSIPNEYVSGGEALGLSKFTIFSKIMIPSVLPQVTAIYIICIGRALAETAALLFTSGYVMRDPESLFDSGRTLSIHIYDLSMNITGGNANAYKTAFVLVIMLLLINYIAHITIRKWTRLSHGR